MKNNYFVLALWAIVQTLFVTLKLTGPLAAASWWAIFTPAFVWLGLGAMGVVGVLLLWWASQ